MALPPLIPRDVLFGNPEKTSPQISPDGKRLAYLAPQDQAGDENWHLFVEAMRKNGKPVEYIVFPDEGHGFARPENNMKFIAAAEAFLAEHMGSRAEPPSEQERVDDLRR